MCRALLSRETELLANKEVRNWPKGRGKEVVGGNKHPTILYWGKTQYYFDFSWSFFFSMWYIARQISWYIEELSENLKKLQDTSFL